MRTMAMLDAPPRSDSIWPMNALSLPSSMFVVDMDVPRSKSYSLNQRISASIALLSKHSNQNEKPDLGQESDAHDRDRKEHVARRERVHECLAPSEAPGVNHSGEGGLRPPAVQPVLTAFIGFPDNHLLEMLALRTSERQKVGMGGTRFDPGQHHPALTLRAAWPMDGKQGWVGMTIGFRHDASLRWAGAQHSQSPAGADMRDGDGSSMLFRLAESVVNIAHIPKEFLF